MIGLHNLIRSIDANEDEMNRKTNLHHGLHPVYHIRQLNIIFPVSNKEVEMISCCVFV